MINIILITIYTCVLVVANFSTCLIGKYFCKDKDTSLLILIPKKLLEKASFISQLFYLEIAPLQIYFQHDQSPEVRWCVNMYDTYTLIFNDALSHHMEQ
jgi:hypothetical protein